MTAPALFIRAAPFTFHLRNSRSGQNFLRFAGVRHLACGQYEDAGGMALRMSVSRISAILRASHAARVRTHLVAVRHFSGPDPEDYKHLKTPKAIEPGKMGSTINAAQGKQFSEILAEDLGRERFEQGPVITDFGTMEKPAEIPSMFPSRIVGCVGDNGAKKHPVLWFDLQAGFKHCCAECGQIFKLVKAQPIDSFATPEATQKKIMERLTNQVESNFSLRQAAAVEEGLGCLTTLTTLE
eukprot:g64215.t1